jgi:hypothetical protein
LTLRVITFWLASSPSLLPPPQAANRPLVIASNSVLDALFFIISLLDTWFGLLDFPRQPCSFDTISRGQIATGARWRQVVLLLRVQLRTNLSNRMDWPQFETVLK